MTDNESEQTGLIRSGERHLIPVDHVVVEDRRCSRRQLFATVAVVGCLSVSLCLAIVLPLTNSGGGGGGGDGGSTAGESGQVLAEEGRPMLRSSMNDDEKPRHEIPHHMRPHRKTWTKVTDEPSELASTPAVMTESPDDDDDDYEDEQDKDKEDDEFASCPRVPRAVRGSHVNMEYVNATSWYELRRIQTRNSPGYAYDVSCSTMQLTMSSSLDAEMQLDWKDGFLFRRHHRNVKLQLHRKGNTSDDWIVDVQNETDKAQITFLVRIDGYLLVYECFPNVHWIPKPGYIIRVFSTSPHGNEARLDVPLMAVAQIWGLNPAEIPSRSIRQHLCNLDLGA